MEYRREVDGLRAVAVMPVILFHSGFDFVSGGFFGVDVFFVISGYLITSIILADLEGDSFSIGKFYERRCRRILPAITLVFAATTIASLFLMMPGDLVENSKATISASLFVSNFFFWQTVGYFQFGSELNPVLHTWSLSVEEQYYLFFPLFMMFFWFLGKKKLALAIVLFAAISFALGQWGSTNAPWASFYLIPTRAWELFIGCIVALYASSRNFLNTGSIRYSILSALGLCLVLFSMVYFDETTPVPGVYALFPTVGTALILLFARRDCPTGKILSNVVFVWIGLISYSAYLWHQPVFVFARLRSVEELGAYEHLPLIFLALMLAYFSWRFIEQPFRQRGFLSRRSIFTLSAASIFAVVAVHSALIVAEGVPGRLPASAVALDEHFEQSRKERVEFISANGCHSWGKARMHEFRKFLNAWSCYGEEEDLTQLPVFITGDSVAAGVAMSLELNELNVGHMSSASCSLVPSLMTPQCKMQSDRLVQLIRDSDEYEQLWLVNRFHDGELDLSSVQEMVEFFSASGADLVFFSSRPQFYALDEKLVKVQTFHTKTASDYRAPMNTDFATLSERSEIRRYLATQNVRFLNTRVLFCSLTPDCSYVTQNGEYLYIDKDHLSIEGAELFGRALIDYITSDTGS